MGKGAVAAIKIACEQALLFGRVKRVSRERASERRSREGPARLTSLTQIGELARRLREKWEREPVSISLTTLSRPFLSRLDSAVKTVNTSVSYNHSQIFRANISRDANSLISLFFIDLLSLLINANVWKFMSSNSLSCESMRFFSALVSCFTRRSDDQKYICCSQATDSSKASANLAIIQSATGFIVIKGGDKFFPLLGRLYSGRLCIFTEQM